MNYFKIYIVFAFLSSSLVAQNVSVSLGTDIPYQFYLGATLETKKMDVSYRTGVLLPPYSDAIITIIEDIGLDEILASQIEAFFYTGWMNSLGGYYKFGTCNAWYVGADIRFDFLFAGLEPLELLTLTQDNPVVFNNKTRSQSEIQLGLRMFGAGFRVGRSFNISSNGRHHLKAEFSMNKYFHTKAFLSFDDKELESLVDLLFDDLENEIDRVIWEEGFKTHGYSGGLGFAYSYRF